MKHVKSTVTGPWWIRPLKLAILTICVLGTVSACSTIAPGPVDSHSIEFDGNKQNAGILGVHRGGGFDVSPFFVEQFNDRATRFGSRLSPPAKALPKGTTVVTSAQMAQSLALARYEREARMK